jgi:hypothetical protein
MPGFDRTGPTGAGPMTGRGLGRCGSGAIQGTSFGYGMGRGGRGRCLVGRGLGWGRGFVGGYVPGASPDEAQALRAELAQAREELAALKSRLDALEK